MTDYSPIEAYSLAELFDNALDGVFVADNAGRYLYVNPAGATLLGYGAGELIEASVDEVIDIADAPRVVAWRESNPVDPQRGEWPARDGSWIDVEVSSQLLPDGRWFGTVRDITERKARDERLRLLAREVDHRANNLMAVVQGAVSLAGGQRARAEVGADRAHHRAVPRPPAPRRGPLGRRRPAPLGRGRADAFAGPGDGRASVEASPSRSAHSWPSRWRWRSTS